MTCVVWTVLWLATAGGLVYLQTRPVPEEWLMTHADALRPVSDYQRVEPAMTRWRAGRPTTVPLDEFWRRAVERPYALLPDSALREFAARISPDAVDASVRRIKTALLSPCSAEMKNHVLADPFGLAAHARALATPALTSSAPAMYVCIEGGTKESALAAAESAARELDALSERGLIGPVQGVSAFLSSPDRQTVRLAEFTRMLNSFQLFATLERTLEREGVDRAVLRGFLDTMRALTAQTMAPETITSQQNRLRLIGMTPVINYFFYRTPRGYMCVHRVLPAPGASLARTRTVIDRALREVYISAIITSPEYFAGVYYQVLRAALWLSGVVWAAGIALIIAAGTIRQYLAILILGRRAGTDTTRFECAPGYRAYMRACGVKHFDDMLDMQHIKGAHVQPLPALPGDVYAPPAPRGAVQAELLTLPAAGHLPRYWQRTGACRLLVYRAYGAGAVQLEQEHRVLQHLRRAGVPVLPALVFGCGTRQGRPCAVMAYAWQDEYTPLVAWQAQRLHAERTGAAQRQSRCTAALAELVRALDSARCRGLAHGAVELVVREYDNGGVRVRLCRAAGLRVMRPAQRVLGWLWPPAARAQRERDFAFVNCCLAREVFSFGARVRLLARVCGVRRGVRTLAHVVARVQRHSARAGYRQYAPQANGVTVNRAEAARLAHSPAHSYEEYMALPGTRPVTRKRGRTVVTVTAGGETWYLKRHTGVSLPAALRALLAGSLPRSQAAAEWAGTLAVQELGIPSVPLLAMGTHMRGGVWERGSFLLTAELRGGTPLETLLRDGQPLPPVQRAALARRLGLLARTLHMAGWAHCDFYLGHIYVVGDLRGTYTLHLLDLQRLRRGAQIGNRWSLKDITALYFSSVPLAGVRDSDRVRFLHAYMGGAAAGRGRRRRFARAILRKSARVAAHTEKLLVRRRARGELS